METQAKILSLFDKGQGKTREEISIITGISYRDVCAVIVDEASIISTKAAEYPETSLGKSRGIRLTDEQWAEAKEMGAGNAAAGVRRLLSEHNKLLREHTQLKEQNGLLEARWLAMSNELQKKIYHTEALESFCDGYKDELKSLKADRDEARQLFRPARWLGYGFLACAALYSAALWVLSLFY